MFKSNDYPQTVHRRPLFQVSVSVSALRIRIHILVVRISIRINFGRKGVRQESLSEPFYPDEGGIRTAFSKIRRQKYINLKVFSNITKMFVHPNTIKYDIHYLSCYFVLN